MGTFSKALEHLKANTFVKREVIKNDTAIVNYKNRLYQMSTKTGIRYPYAPTNKDLMANDWLALSVRSDGEFLEEKTEKNIKIVSDFMNHCKTEGFKLPDSVFESYFNA